MGTHLGIVMPGQGYGPQGPVLRYPALVLRQLGAEVRTVAYPDLDDQLDEVAQWRKFSSDVGRQVSAFVDEVQPERLTFVAKSLGTIALANLDPALLSAVSRTEAVWLTPLFGRPDVRDGAVARWWRSLIVAGAADRAHDAGAHAEVVAALGAESVVLDGADHSLEVAGDIETTVAHHRVLVERVLRFLAG